MNQVITPIERPLPIPMTVYLRLEDALRIDAYADEACMTPEDFLEVMVLVGLTTHTAGARNRAELAE